jgi:hypothetical protein
MIGNLKPIFLLNDISFFFLGGNDKRKAYIITTPAKPQLAVLGNSNQATINQITTANGRNFRNIPDKFFKKDGCCMCMLPKNYSAICGVA